MDFPFDEDVLKNGFCWGEHVRRIDEMGRLRLNKDIAGMLAERGIMRLWRCPDPAGRRFILCPPEYRQRFVSGVQNRFEETEKVESVYRLVCSGTEGRIDRESRINIPQVCLKQAGIQPPQLVTLLGVGFWFEVSVWTARGDSTRNLCE